MATRWCSAIRASKTARASAARSRVPRTSNVSRASIWQTSPSRTASTGPPEDLGGIRDFDGNDLGAPEGWKFIATADAQYDGDAEHVYVNPEIARWATVGPDADGTVDFADHGQGGDTRVVGIYIDPLVASGEVEHGSDFDSQRRLQNDLEIGNLAIVDAFDFDADGFQEVYFEVTDGTAYLRALMHADGNIQYANYQTEDQMRDYLGGLGYGAEVIDAILVRPPRWTTPADDRASVPPLSRQYRGCGLRRTLGDQWSSGRLSRYSARRNHAS